MCALFRNRFRIEPARWNTWDYSGAASYFITICTAGFEHYFGKIADKKFFASPIGIIAEREWRNTAERRKDMNLEMTIFVVMPNHVHGIITIGMNAYNKLQAPDPDKTQNHSGQRHQFNLITNPDELSDALMERKLNDRGALNQFGPQRKNLASIIRGYKSAVTSYARQHYIPFQWQSRYHDHVIRNMHEFNRIADYIENNVNRWNNDRFKTP